MDFAEAVLAERHLSSLNEGAPYETPYENPELAAATDAAIRRIAGRAATGDLTAILVLDELFADIHRARPTQAAAVVGTPAA